MWKALHIDPAKCTGCLQCEMACSYEHTGVINPSKSRIKVFNFEHEGRKVPYTCTQCTEAWCLNSCPVDAIRIDLTTKKTILDKPQGVGHHGHLQAVLGDVFRLNVAHQGPAVDEPHAGEVGEEVAGQHGRPRTGAMKKGRP